MNSGLPKSLWPSCCVLKVKIRVISGRWGCLRDLHSVDFRSFGIGQKLHSVLNKNKRCIFHSHQEFYPTSYSVTLTKSLANPIFRLNKLLFNNPVYTPVINYFTKIFLILLLFQPITFSAFLRIWVCLCLCVCVCESCWWPQMMRNIGIKVWLSTNLDP